MFVIAKMRINAGKMMIRVFNHGDADESMEAKMLCVCFSARGTFGTVLRVACEAQPVCRRRALTRFDRA